MTDKQFNDSLSFHFDDPAKIEKVKEVREEAEIDNGEGLEAEERKKIPRKRSNDVQQGSDGCSES